MKLFYTLLFFFLFQTSFATTYYISPRGNNLTGNGSIQNPWQTLYHATAIVQRAGDIIHVTAGTYVETLQCALAVGVHLEGEGAASVLKSTLAEDWKALLTASSDEGTNGNQHISHLTFDGQDLTGFWAIYVGGRSNVSVHDCVVMNFKDRGIIFEGRSGGYNTEPSIYARGNSFYNNTVNNCAAYNTPLGIYGRGCLNIGGQQGMLIYNNNITQNSRPEGYNGWPIKANDDGFLKGCKIYNNTLTKIALGNPNGITGWDFAIELFNVSGLEIYNNRITGSVDLNHQLKGDYSYSAYIHDNIIAQPKLQPQTENGIILEFGTEAAIIERNHFKNIGVIVYFTPRDGSIVNNVTIKNNLCENIGVANGSHQGFAIRFGEEGNHLFFLEDLIIDSNKFLGSAAQKPYWGIGILGVSLANNIKIQHNSFTNFSAGYLTANPASVIDTMIVDNNILSGNGYNNKAAFIAGEPKYFVHKNNTASNGIIFSLANLKMNIIRPLYYGIKNISLLELIAVCAAIFAIWFCRKENIYFYPLWLIAVAGGTFLSFDEGFMAKGILGFYFVLISAYGWHLWSKRDKRKHRIVRVTASGKKELLLQFLLFAIIYAVLFICLSYFKNDFGNGIITWADALVFSAACNALWLTVNKKVESWYWWIAACTLSIPLYFVKHFVVSSAYYGIILIFLLGGLYEWKKRSRARKKVGKD
jgi:nicotinamide mononucleotide transporter